MYTKEQIEKIKRLMVEHDLCVYVKTLCGTHRKTPQTYHNHYQAVDVMFFIYCEPSLKTRIHRFLGMTNRGW
jgi:hypothetical protein